MLLAAWRDYERRQELPLSNTSDEGIDFADFLTAHVDSYVSNPELAAAAVAYDRCVIAAAGLRVVEPHTLPSAEGVYQPTRNYPDARGRWIACALAYDVTRLRDESTHSVERSPVNFLFYRNLGAQSVTVARVSGESIAVLAQCDGTKTLACIIAQCPAIYGDALIAFLRELEKRRIIVFTVEPAAGVH
jgi:hypothetical protein